jgi:hypothetical protein
LLRNGECCLIAYPLKNIASIRVKRKIIQGVAACQTATCFGGFTIRRARLMLKPMHLSQGCPLSKQGLPTPKAVRELPSSVRVEYPIGNGGFEQFAEKVSSQLADRGHEVTVIAVNPSPRLMTSTTVARRRVILPTIHQKHLDTWSIGLISSVHVAFSDNDVVLMCNVANSPFAWVPRLFGKPVVLNVDGLDRRRGKWNALGQVALHVCEWMSTFTPSRVVTDAKPIHEYYRQRYGKDLDGHWLWF